MGVRDIRTPSVDRPIVLPTWADPYWVSAISDYSVRRATVSGNQLQTLVAANPARYMIGFRPSGAVPLNAAIAPYSNPTPEDFTALTAGELSWFKLFDFGPLPGLQWYVVNGDGMTVVIHEVKLQV